MYTFYEAPSPKLCNPFSCFCLKLRNSLLGRVHFCVIAPCALLSINVLPHNHSLPLSLLKHQIYIHSIAYRAFTSSFRIILFGRPQLYKSDILIILSLFTILVHISIWATQRPSHFERVHLANIRKKPDTFHSIKVLFTMFLQFVYLK